MKLQHDQIFIDYTWKVRFQREEENLFFSERRGEFIFLREKRRIYFPIPYSQQHLLWPLVLGPHIGRALGPPENFTTGNTHTILI